MAAHTIAMLNRKGGVGKSSSCFHLAGALAKSGRRVLLIDADPQASLTQGFIGPHETEMLPREKSITALFDDALDPLPEELILHTKFEGVHLLPASEYLTDYNVPRPAEAGPIQYALEEFRKEVRAEYDTILIDCPPHLQLCSWSALLASDFVAVPLQAEDFAAQGLINVLRVLDNARTTRNPRLILLGYLLQQHVTRTAIHSAVETMLRDLYGEQVFQSFVPYSVTYKEAISKRTPIGFLKPKSAPAKAIEAVGEEILERIQKITTINAEAA